MYKVPVASGSCTRLASAGGSRGLRRRGFSGSEPVPNFATPGNPPPRLLLTLCSCILHTFHFWVSPRSRLASTRCVFPSATPGFYLVIAAIVDDQTLKSDPRARPHGSNAWCIEVFCAD